MPKGHSNIIGSFVFLCIHNCYPKVLQDVIAEGMYVKQRVSELTLYIFGSQ